MNKFSFKTLLCGAFAAAVVSCNSKEEGTQEFPKAKGNYHIESAKAGPASLKKVEGHINLMEYDGKHVLKIDKLKYEDPLSKKMMGPITFTEKEGLKVEWKKKEDDKSWTINLRDEKPKKGDGHAVVFAERNVQMTLPVSLTDDMKTALGEPLNALTSLELSNNMYKMKDFLHIKAVKDPMGYVKMKDGKTILNIKMKFKPGRKWDADQTKFIASIKKASVKTAINAALGYSGDDSVMSTRKTTLTTLITGLLTKLKAGIQDPGAKYTEFTIEAKKE